MGKLFGRGSVTSVAVLMAVLWFSNSSWAAQGNDCQADVREVPDAGKLTWARDLDTKELTQFDLTLKTKVFALARRLRGGGGTLTVEMWVRFEVKFDVSTPGVTGPTTHEREVIWRVDTKTHTPIAQDGDEYDDTWTVSIADLRTSAKTFLEEEDFPGFTVSNVQIFAKKLHFHLEIRAEAKCGSLNAKDKLTAEIHLIEKPKGPDKEKPEDPSDKPKKDDVPGGTDVPIDLKEATKK